MGKQGQYQFKGQVSKGVPETTYGIDEHELSDTRGIYERRLPVLVCQLVR